MMSPRRRSRLLLSGLLAALGLVLLALAIWIAVPSPQSPQTAAGNASTPPPAPPLDSSIASAALLFPAPTDVRGEKLPPGLWRAASTLPPVTKGREAKLDRGISASIARLREGDPVDLSLFDGVVAHGTVNLIQHETGGWFRVGGSLDGPQSGSFSLGTDGTHVGGLIQFPSRNLAFQIVDDGKGNPILRERLLSDVLCLPMPRPDFESTTTSNAATTTAAAAPPLLSSRPLATSVLYLDFDGETVTDPLWNNGHTIVAKVPNLTNTQIQQIWQRVKEDYWPFDVDVTTDLTRYTGAAVRHRMRCIITPTDTASPGAGGVAYVDSFAEAGTGTFSNTIPCWVFNTSVTGISEAIAHELGHTLGLHHDGKTSPVTEYYAGQGTGDTGWAPIMGVGYNKSLVQWSKGEYLNANNKEDDLAIISGTANAFGYVADEAGDTIQTAASLSVSGTAVNQPGIITKVTDTDVYVFTTAAGPVAITANPAPLSPDLDIVLDLLDSDGAVLATNNPADTLPAAISMNVPGGVYYLRIRGTGKGDPLVTGYTAYASIGEYTLTGTIPGGAPAPSITSATTASGEVTLHFSYQITATNSPTSYTLTGTLPNGITFQSGTGTLAGTPTESGTFNLTMQAINAAGSDSKPLTLTIAPLQPPVISSPSTAVGTIAYAFNYQIVASHQPTSYDVVGTLPMGLGIDAETGVISGTPQESGNFPVSLEAMNDAGTGTAPLTITITVSPPPTITSAGFVTARVGTPFSYQIVATQNPTSYGYTGTLPGGIDFDSGTATFSGTPTEDGLFTLSISATNDFGTTTQELKINVNPAGVDLTDALDDPDLTWATSGDGFWKSTTGVTHDGVDAATISGLNDNQTSVLETSVEGPASLRFFWRVSSEQDYDCLTFSVDGVEHFRISGEVDWQLITLPITAGTHQLTFRYRKDAYGAKGADAAWVDQVSLFPREGAPGSDSFAGAQALTGAHVALATNNLDATVEPDEPTPVSGGFGHSLWWSWTAPDSGMVTLSTIGSQFDTQLAVYTGEELATLVKVASDDDLSRANQASRVRFRASAGTTYFIEVAGYSNYSGLVALTLDYTARGDYAGIVFPDADADKLTGLLTLHVSSNLNYTGSIRIGGGRYSFRGSLASGADNPMASRAKGLPPLLFTLSTDLANGDSTVIGTASDGVQTYHFTARRRIARADVSEVAPGAYTVLLEPATLGSTVAYGSGYGRAIVGANGSIRFTGAFGDGQSVSEGGVLTYGSIWPCFLSPYRKKAGTMSGDVNFDAVLANSFTGNLRWRVEDPAGGTFSDDVTLTGAFYFTPTTSFPALSVSAPTENVQLTFSHRDPVANPPDPVGTFTPPSLFTSFPSAYALTLNPKTGLLTGYLPDPTSAIRRPFHGALLQSENRAAGNFTSSTGHGRVDLNAVP